jgi:hypothetical protein
MNPEIPKVENTERNKAVRKKLSEDIKFLGRCAFVDCSECNLLLKHPTLKDVNICLLVNL